LPSFAVALWNAQEACTEESSQVGEPYATPTGQQFTVYGP
jgi:hypothetical protein